MIANCKVVQAVWEEAVDVVRDLEICACIDGVQHCMTTFKYFFSILLGEVLLKHTHNLNKT